MSKPARGQKPLTDSEITDLLRPHGNVDRAYVVLDNGEKIYLTTRGIPTAVVGGFQKNAAGQTKYNAGSPRVVAYKEGDTT